LDRPGQTASADVLTLPMAAQPPRDEVALLIALVSGDRTAVVRPVRPGSSAARNSVAKQRGFLATWEAV